MPRPRPWWLLSTAQLWEVAERLCPGSEREVGRERLRSHIDHDQTKYMHCRSLQDIGRSREDTQKLDKSMKSTCSRGSGVFWQIIPLIVGNAQNLLCFYCCFNIAIGLRQIGLG